MLDINIVIVNWKMKADIDRCLESLFNDVKDGNLEIVVQVIDNSGNSDGTEEMLKRKYPQVKYANPGTNLGFGKAQNLGLKKFPARFYLPLNPDVEFMPESRVLAKLVKFLEDNPEVGMAAPKLLNIDGSVQLSCFRFSSFLAPIFRRAKLDKKLSFLKKSVDYYLMADFDHKSNRPVDWLMGSFMLIRQELTDQIGFFDDRYFMYFEDCDWCRRAWRNGWQVYYLAEVMVKHGHRRESAEQSAFVAVFKNPVARTHLKSWLKYFLKWGIKKEHFGY